MKSMKDHKYESLRLLSVQYNEMKKVLFSYGHKFTNDVQLIEDCIHDVFLKLCEKENLSTIRHMNVYLLRTFRNRLNDEMARKPSIADISEIPSDLLRVRSDEACLIETEEAIRIENAITQMMACLTKRQRQLIMLHYLEQRSYDEICHLLGISYQTVRNKMNQALKRIRDHMDCFSNI